MKLMREGTDGKGQITFLADVPFHAQFNRAISVKGVCMIALLAIYIVEKKTINMENATERAPRFYLITFMIGRLIFLTKLKLLLKSDMFAQISILFLNNYSSTEPR